MRQIFLVGGLFLSTLFFFEIKEVDAQSCRGSGSGLAGTCKPLLTCPSSSVDSASICDTDGLICCTGSVGGQGSGTDSGSGIGTGVGSGIGSEVGGVGTGSGAGTGSSAGSISCDGEVRAGVCFPSSTAIGLSDAPVDSLLLQLMNWLLAIFGFLGIIAFVISGLQYLLASADEDMAETAKRNMTYSIIGVIVALSGFVIIQAIDTALSGSGYFF